MKEDQFLKNLFGVEKGIESVSESGILAGFPIIDYKVKILDGLHHDVDSSVLASKLQAEHVLERRVKKQLLNY